MIATTVVLALYVVIGASAALLAARRSAALGAWSGAGAWIAVGLLWPFLLPGLVAAPAGAPAAVPGPHAERAGALGRAMSAALEDPATVSLIGRSRAEIEAALRRVEVEARRLGELDRALESAIPAARPRLLALRSHAESQLVERLGLLEEVAAQLTVLRFMDMAAPDEAAHERLRVEALRTQLDVLVGWG